MTTVIDNQIPASFFSVLSIQPALIKNLDSLAYKVMTPIQEQSLPLILEGKDVIAQAKTGSGKTAAFGLGLLNKLKVKEFRIQSLILCPTRELADQVAKELRKLARTIHNIKILTLCGGMPYGPQKGSLEHGAHIIVGTPGRIEEHLRKGNLQLENLNMLVLDEADRMLDMGFQASIDAIISHIPSERQTLLFSATYPSQIQRIAKGIMRNPVIVKVESQHSDSSIEQIFYKIDKDQSRAEALRLLLLKQRPGLALIFCNTKKETRDLCTELKRNGFSAASLHGDLEQKQRDQTLVCFANNSISILVATDVAARGLDIAALDAVYNYQIARELEVHTHRIGRTGRAGNHGFTCTLYSDKEAFKFAALKEYLAQDLKTEKLPSAELLKHPSYQPPMVTLQIGGGKKQKIRAGDILGALTGSDGINADDVGKIQLFDNWAFVAIKREASASALSKLDKGKLKGRSFRVRKISF